MYQLDTTAARKADTTSNQINELGKYIGVFTQAEDVNTKKGGKGLALNFLSDAGQKSKLSIYTKMADGKQISGFETLMAILTCLKLRSIKPVAGTVTRWDNDTRTEVQQQGMVFNELCNKPIGLLLETEEYLSQNNELKSRMVLKSVFEASTEFTATEILDNKTSPVQLAKMVEALRHRPLKGAKPMPTHAAHGGYEGHSSSVGMDDIPF